MRQKSHFFNLEMLFGPLYEKNMKNMEKNGTSTLPEIFEKLSNLTEI